MRLFRNATAPGFLLPALLLLAAGRMAAAAETPPPPPYHPFGKPVSRAQRDAYVAMFEQWRALPLPDVVGHPRVEVKLKSAAAPDQPNSHDGLSWPLSNRGFLLREDPGTFSVLLDCGRAQTFLRRPTMADDVPYAQAAWEVIDPVKEIRHLLSLPPGLQPGRNPLPASRLTVYYAYLAYRLRLPELDGVLARLENPELRSADEPRDTVALWRERRAMYLLWSAGADIRYRQPWSAAQAQCRMVADSFPGTAAASQAKELAAQLDAASREKSPPDRVPGSVGGWVTGLSAQDSPLFLTPPDQAAPFQPRSPAARLVEADLAAVPQLMELLGDPRVTRSVSLELRGLYVGRYGDFALRVLEKIAARAFLPRDGREHPDPTQAIRLARAWWEDVRRRGERAVLTDGVLLGPDNTPQAERLADRYPLDALPVLTRAIRGLRDPGERAALVGQVSQLPGSAALLHDLLAEPEPEVRVAAARALYDRGDDAGLEPVLALLRELLGSVRVEAQVGVRTEPEPESAAALQNVVEFLSNMREGWALTSAWRSLSRGPAFLKSIFLNSLDESDAPAEEALALALKDRAVLPPGYLQVQGFDLPAARVCDVAAALLARRLPHLAAPAAALSLRRRDREVARVGNAWMADQGLAFAEAPEVPPAPSPDADSLCRDLAVPARAAAARERLLALGARAVPALRRAAGGPSAAAALALLRQVTSRVSRVTVEGVPADHPAARAAAAWRGHSLDLEAVGALLQSVGKGTWKDIEGWDLVIDQPRDGTGADIELRFLHPEKATPADSFDIQFTFGDGEDNPNEVAIWQKTGIATGFRESLSANRPHLQNPRLEFLILLQARRSESAPPPPG